MKAPKWIEKIAADLIMEANAGTSAAEITAKLQEAIEANPPKLPKVPWRVTGIYAKESEFRGEYILGFKCLVPDDVIPTEEQKEKWLKALLPQKDL